MKKHYFLILLPLLLIHLVTGTNFLHGAAIVGLDDVDTGSVTGVDSAGTYSAAFDGGFSIDGLNTNRALVIAMNWENNGSGAVTGISWGGTSLTEVQTETVSRNSSSIWFLANPDAGSQTLQITTSGGFGGNYTGSSPSAVEESAYFAAYSLYNAQQQTPTIFDGSSSDDSSMVREVTLSGMSDGSFGIDAVMFNIAEGTPAISFSATEALDTPLYGGGATGGSSYTENITGGTFTFTDTLSATDGPTRSMQSAIAVQPIPEPQAAVLLAFGAVIMLLGRRVRRG